MLNIATLHNPTRVYTPRVCIQSPDHVRYKSKPFSACSHRDQIQTDITLRKTLMRNLANVAILRSMRRASGGARTCVEVVFPRCSECTVHKSSHRSRLPPRTPSCECWNACLYGRAEGGDLVSHHGIVHILRSQLVSDSIHPRFTSRLQAVHHSIISQNSLGSG